MEIKIEHSKADWGVHPFQATAVNVATGARISLGDYSSEESRDKYAPIRLERKTKKPSIEFEKFLTA